MAKLLPLTATLVVKIPDNVYIQPFKEKNSVKMNILRKISQTLKTEDLELISVGHKEEPALYNTENFELSTDSTIVSINVLETADDVYDFNASLQMILKRFKKELLKNDEHIIIDKSEAISGHTVRTIEVYIKRVAAKKKIAVTGYAFSTNTLIYA